MKFLLQYNLLSNESLLELKAAVKNLPHQWVGVIPFSHELTTEPDQPLDGLDYIPYGSTTMIKLSKQLGFNGLHFSELFTYFNASVNRFDMLNSSSNFDRVVPLYSLVAYIDELDSDDLLFLRPSEDLKAFAGQVMSVA